MLRRLLKKSIRSTDRGPRTIYMYFSKKIFDPAVRRKRDRGKRRLSRVSITIYKYYYRVRFRVASPFSPNKLTISAAVKYQTAVRMNYVCCRASQKKKKKKHIKRARENRTISDAVWRVGRGVRRRGGRSEGYFVSPDREKNISFLFILQKQ